MLPYNELFKIRLKAAARAGANRTIHYGTNGRLPPPVALSIVQYAGDTGFYLFYLDETGHEQTDTYHDTLDAAFRQAEYEFGVKQNDWLAL